MARVFDAGAAPFSESYYALGLCELRAMKAEWAAPLAVRLAQTDPWLTLAYTPDSLSHYLASTSHDLRCFAVMSSAEVSGAVCVRFPWLRGAYLELIGLYPETRGRGIGRAVIGWIEREAQSRVDNLWALTSSFNAPARSFYQRCGFAEIGTITDFVRSGFDEILVRRVINSRHHE